MPIKLPAELTEQVADEVSRHSDGIAIGDLATTFAGKASRRSLARILKRLARAGRIRAQGDRKGTRYFPPHAIQRRHEAAEAPDALRAEAEVYVPLTGESAKVRGWVRWPITQRKPVGYDRALLDAYEPNRTFYLSDADWRARLREIGRTPGAAQVAGTYARDVLNRLLIDLSWASSRLEGNTYSRLDTQALIEHGRIAEGKDRRETQMILNHKRAIEFLVENAGEIGFNMFTFMNLHSLLSESLLANPADSGRLRMGIVEIDRSAYLPLQVPQQIEDLFRLILEKAAAIADPFEQSFFLMVHIPYLQPFMDVNKRTSRLAANIPFIRSGLCPLSFVDVPERAYVEGTLAVYEHARVDLLRDVYIWAYERSCARFKAIAAMLPEPDPFRLKYRAELSEVVREFVRAAKAASAQDIERAAAKLVPSQDLPKFTDMVAGELRQLHEGNIARYGLRLEEFRAWRNSLPKA